MVVSGLSAFGCRSRQSGRSFRRQGGRRERVAPNRARTCDAPFNTLKPAITRASTDGIPTLRLCTKTRKQSFTALEPYLIP